MRLRPGHRVQIRQIRIGLACAVVAAQAPQQGVDGQQLLVAGGERAGTLRSGIGRRPSDHPARRNSGRSPYPACGPGIPPRRFRDEIQRVRPARGRRFAVRRARARLGSCGTSADASGKQRPRQQPGHGVRLVFHRRCPCGSADENSRSRLGQQPVIKRPFQGMARVRAPGGMNAQGVDFCCLQPLGPGGVKILGV